MLKPKQVAGIIQTHKEKSKHERVQWDKYRSWYLSEYWKEEGELPSGAGDAGDEEVNFETNYPYAYVDTMIANVCPTNPQMTVMARQADLRAVAQFREAVINDTLRRNKTHTLLWKQATNAALCGRGFLKTVWNFPRSTVDYYSVDPRFVMYDQAAAKWEDIRYIMEVTVLTKAEFQKRTKPQGPDEGALYNPEVAKKARFGGYPSWLRDNVRNKSMINEASKAVYDWVTVYEFYDFEGEGRYYHMLDGVETPLFEGDLPYRYTDNPFVQLVFNDNMVDLGGVSDVRLIASSQERLNEIDTLELWHAAASNPVLLVQTGLVDAPEQIMTALRDANQPGSMVGIPGKANAPLHDLIGHTPTPQFQPSFDKMRDRATHTIEFILGIPQYSRGVVGVADVATEVALADTSTRTRNGRRIKAVEDVIKQLGTNTIGLYEEYLDEDTILPIRLTDSVEVLEVTREMLAARSDDSEEHPMDYDYDAVPFSPTENHRLIQLQKIQQYMELLLQSQQVDQDKLIVKLLQLLGLTDILRKEPPTPAAPPGMEAMAGMMGAGAPPDPSMAGGDLPPGVQEPAPAPLPVGGPGAPSPTQNVTAGFQGAAQGFTGAPF